MEAKPGVEAANRGQGVSLSKKSRKKSSRSSQVLMCISDCKYDVVREAARAKGWKLVEEDPEASTRRCHVYWIDVPAIVERMQHLHRWQRINHFPGMSNVARKGRLAQNLDRMRRNFPHEYSFYPRTWVLPVEWGAFKTEFDASGKTTRTFIIKPDSGCQGRGIFLTQDLDRVDPMESQVAQLYVQRPLLIEGFKFDLRLYVLVTSVIPLRVYAFKDGLTRFCTEEYARASGGNLGRRCMHLTNYAVNKSSENFVANDHADRDDLGSKRSLRWLLGWIASERGGQEKADALWRKMGEAITKTLVSVLPTLHREYLHTFGPDEGVRRPAGCTSVNDKSPSKNDSDCLLGVGEARCSGARPPPQEEARGEQRMPSQSSSDCAVTTASERRAAGPANVSVDESPRTRRGGDGSVESAEDPSDDSACSPRRGAGGDSAPPREGGERKTLSPSPTREVVNTNGVVEDLCDDEPSSGSVVTQSVLGEESRESREQQVPSPGRSDPPAEGGSNNIPGTSNITNNSHPGGDSGKAAGTGGGGRWGVVEGSRCVEILGFDFMIDAALKPWLIEVNHLPSFATDSPLDRRIKAQVVNTALSVLHAKAEDKKSYEENAKRDAQNRLYNSEAGGGLAQRERERKEVEAAVAKIRRKLEAIYSRFAPHKLGKVGGLLARYAGEEDKLLRIVRRKYVDTGGVNASAASAGTEEVISVSIPCGDDGADGQEAGDHQRASSSALTFDTTVAPVHGSENSASVTEGTEGRRHRSRESLLESTANQSEGKASRSPRAGERALFGESTGEDKRREDGSVKALPPEAARTPEPPQDDPRGRGVSGTRGNSGRKESPAAGSRSTAPLSSPPTWKTAGAKPSAAEVAGVETTREIYIVQRVNNTQQDLEALSREAEILEGWERLHPPPDAAEPVACSNPLSPPTVADRGNDGRDDDDSSNGNSNNSNSGRNTYDKHDGSGGSSPDTSKSEGGEDRGVGCGVGVKGGRKRRKAAAAVEMMIQRAFEDDRKMTLRLKCPLQQQRGGAMDPQQQQQQQQQSATTKLPQVGGSFLTSATTASDPQNNRSSAPSVPSTPPVVLGPEQREKAQRLMEGYSSNSRRSSSAPSHPSGGPTTSASDERSTLPVSLRIAVIRAKEWRRRRDEGNARRNSHSVAIKMHTFDFGGVPGEDGHQA